MKIADSSVLMSAKGSYAYYERTGTSVQTMQRTNSSQDTLQTGSFKDELYAGYTRDGALSDDGNGQRALRTGTVTANDDSQKTLSAGSMRDNLLMLLFARFVRSGMFGNMLSTGTSLPLFSLTGSSPTAMQVNHYECEEVAFKTQGQAVTEDGRVLSFAMNISLSRTLVEATQVAVPTLSSFLMDPLVVNVGRAVTAVSDQTFRFDLDADGEEEDVARLSSGSGFLALDKNGDGVINDGSELFGAVSGDGFGDLRAYDSDGNGWIDENDEIFEKLLVWYRDGDGEEQLVHLKDADIGAICLGEQSTDFTLSGMDGRVNGRMRSTGFFLKESGGMGTVQHVDLAVHKDGDTADNGLARNIGGENFVSGYGRGDRVVPDVLVVPVGNTADKASAENSMSEDTETEQKTTDTEDAKESAAKRRAKAAEERERLRREQQERYAQRKRRNEELTEEAIEHRREEEERINELFADRAERREEAETAAQERQAIHEEFEAEAAEEQQAIHEEVLQSA